MRPGLLPAAAALSVILSSASSLRADEIGNAQRGLAYAEKNCAGCHAVRSDERESPNPDSPVFKAVADTPGITRTALSVFLQSPHPTMPNLILKGEDADDVIAYILSLKTPAKSPTN